MEKYLGGHQLWLREPHPYLVTVDVYGVKHWSPQRWGRGAIDWDRRKASWKRWHFI